jgi:hypothetical protein
MGKGLVVALIGTAYIAGWVSGCWTRDYEDTAVDGARVHKDGSMTVNLQQIRCGGNQLWTREVKMLPEPSTNQNSFTQYRPNIKTPWWLWISGGPIPHPEYPGTPVPIKETK